MGKSLGNAIYLADDEETVMKKVMNATTDPSKIKKDDPANPDICMVYYYQKIFNENVQTVCSECKKGERGCVTCKKELSMKIMEFLKPIQEKRKYYEEHPEIVDESLRIGTERAQNVAKQNMKRIKEKMKINYFDK